MTQKIVATELKGPRPQPQGHITTAASMDGGAPQVNIPGAFQSDEAREAALPPAQRPEEVPTSSEVEPPRPPVPQYPPVNLDAQVVVQPRITVARCYFGGKWHKFEAGKRCLVSRALEMHLREKGIL